jgi:hypothetical protein
MLQYIPLWHYQSRGSTRRTAALITVSSRFGEASSVAHRQLTMEGRWFANLGDWARSPRLSRCRREVFEVGWDAHASDVRAPRLRGIFGHVMHAPHLDYTAVEIQSMFNFLQFPTVNFGRSLCDSWVLKAGSHEKVETICAQEMLYIRSITMLISARHASIGRMLHDRRSATTSKQGLYLETESFLPTFLPLDTCPPSLLCKSNSIVPRVPFHLGTSQST